MMQQNIDDLTHRKATIKDLKKIIGLLLEDDFGSVRENASYNIDQAYIDAFERIDSDPAQYLMVVEEYESKVIGTCQLTLIPSLTFVGSTRLQIEAVRVAQSYRGKGIGEWMIRQAIEYGKAKGASIIQLTTNKERLRAQKFYESLGFQSTHEGMKILL